MSDWFPGGTEWDECNFESAHEQHGWERKGVRVKSLEEASTMSNFELVKEMLRVYHRTKDSEKAKIICNLLYTELCEEDE